MDAVKVALEVVSRRPSPSRQYAVTLASWQLLVVIAERHCVVAVNLHVAVFGVACELRAEVHQHCWEVAALRVEIRVSAIEG